MKKSAGNKRRSAKEVSFAGNVVGVVCLVILTGCLVVSNLQMEGPGVNYLGQTVWPGFMLATVVIFGLLLLGIYGCKLYEQVTGRPTYLTPKKKRKRSVGSPPRVPASFLWQGW